MGLVAVVTIVLMPPTGLLLKLPGLSRLVGRWPEKILSKVLPAGGVAASKSTGHARQTPANLVESDGA